MKIKKIICFLLAFSPFFAFAVSATSKTHECVGNLSVIFPGQVEVAANTAEMLIEEHNVGSIQPKFRFVDGEIAGWTSIAYGGNVFVSHVLNGSQKEKLITSQKKLLISAKKFEKKDKEKNSSFKVIDVGTRLGFAAQVGSSFTASLFLQDHMIWRQSTVSDAAVAKTEADYLDFVKNVNFRAIGLVPTIPGLCLPYFFIPAQVSVEKVVGKIASTYRLKDHPDMTVWIEDSNSGDDANRDKEKSTQPLYQVNDFWSQYEILPGISKIESEWHFPAGRRVKISGGEGIASFVKIKRKSGVVDYGYMAVIQGDNKDQLRSPSIKFYVIRNSESSLRKNIEPVSKDEFLKISEEIVSNIKGNLGR
jgi:hypothetical protein